MPIGPSDLGFPAQRQHAVERWANTDIRRGPDFTGLNNMFGSLMSNPSLIARGGTFTDPMQAQQEATPGYLQGRGGVAANRLNRIAGDASLAESAGQSRAQLLDLMTQLQALKLNQSTAQGSLFSNLLGGLF